MTAFAFNAASVPPQESFTPVPAGTYVAQVIDSDVAPTSSGQGTALKLTFQILSGAYANRKVFANINVVHRGSPDAERIGQSQLSALCHAVGVLNLADTSQLHGKPVSIRVTIKKDDAGRWGDKNEIRSYEAVSGAAAANLPPGRQPATPAQQPAAAAPMPAAAPAAASAPWARRAA